MYHVALCDDDKVFLEIVEKNIKNFCKIKNIKITLHTFNESDTLMECIESKKMFDIYILDIVMPNYTGVEIAKKIRDNFSGAYIIFLTAYLPYAVEACCMNIFRFILKDKFIEQFDEALGELFLSLNKCLDGSVYVIRNQRRFVKFYHKDIIYIYKKSKNAIFVLPEGVEESERVTLQEVKLKLDNPNMILIDRCIIINLHHVCKINGRIICLTGGYEITAGKNRIAAVRGLLNRQ